MRQTRHRSAEVALGYLRPADLWRNNVTEKLFSGPKDEGEVTGTDADRSHRSSVIRTRNGFACPGPQ